ncbi:MAG: CheR family methyltransferase [Acidobacteriota bacterium]
MASENLLSRVSYFIANRLGLHFAKERWGDLERGLSYAARASGFNDKEAYVEDLISTPITKEKISMLASYITIGETYFFREQNSFDAIRESIIPELISSCRRSGRKARIWCAGCCSGEEPYSVAIMLKELFPEIDDRSVTIFATDINANFLDKAAKGEYNEWSFRNTPFWIKERYFKNNSRGRFEILPSIKKLVTFSYLNLAEDIYSLFSNNTLDLIFCRNVLIYFTPKQSQKLVENLYHTLAYGGWLLVSPSELSTNLFAKFTAVNSFGAILYRKDREKQQPISFFNPIENIDFPSELVSISLTQSQEPITAELPEQLITKPDPQMEALALYERGLYQEAIEKLFPLVSLCQENQEAIMLLSRAYANQGKLNDALEWCRKGIAANRLNPRCYYLLSTILQEKGDIEAAAISLKHTLYLDQNYVLAHFALGNLALQQGKEREAQRHFENTFELLQSYQQEDILPESEGIMAGSLMQAIKTMMRD